MSDNLDTGDVAAGFPKPHEYTVWEDIQGYLIRAGAGGAAHGRIILRGLHPLDLGAGHSDRAGVLAVAQIGVHLVFFLHLTTAPDNTNNVLALAFGVLIVALVIGGSVWIMGHLDERMMPSMNQMMQMQR